jgi:N-acetylneuraminic acid mutarotase
MAEWIQRPPLSHARAGLDGATVDGRILAIGGFDPALPVFDFVEVRRVQGPGAWQTLPPLPTPRANLAAAELDGFVYAAGGLDSDGNGFDVVEKFDPDGDSWSPSPSLPEDRAVAGAAGLDGRLYVAGGATNVEASINSVVAFRPGDGAWAAAAPMPTGRERLRLVAVGRHLYAIGGQSVDGLPLSTVERYDPQSDTWQAVASMQEARILPGVVAFRRGNDRFIVVVGGATGPPDNRFMLRTTEIYNIGTDRWHVIATRLPRGAVSLICATEINGEVLAIGGATDRGVTGAEPSPTGEVLALRLTNEDLQDE